MLQDSAPSFQLRPACPLGRLRKLATGDAASSSGFLPEGVPYSSEHELMFFFLNVFQFFYVFLCIKVFSCSMLFCLHMVVPADMAPRYHPTPATCSMAFGGCRTKCGIGILFVHVCTRHCIEPLKPLMSLDSLGPFGFEDLLNLRN